METIKIDILNPIALKLLNNLADLKLIKIKKSNNKNDFSDLVNQLRSKTKDKITLEEITNEVEKVRKLRNVI